MIDVTHQQKVDDAGVLSFGIIVDEIGPLYISQAGDDTVDDLVHPENLANHGLQIRKERMVGVGHIVNLAAMLFGFEQVGAGQLVEFLPDGIGRYPELV